MVVLDFIINEIFGQGAIFIALIAMIGLLLQKKSASEVIRGTCMTAVGFFILSTGTGLITGNSIDGIATAFNTMMPQAIPSTTVDIGAQFGTEIGIVMVVAFAINLLVARFTKWKSVFLTGHMLYWFPFVFIAAGVDAGLTGGKLIALATVFTAVYMIVSPNLMRPFVKQVTGDDSFTIGHPTTCLSVMSGLIGKVIGNKNKSTEDLKIRSLSASCVKLRSPVLLRSRSLIWSCISSCLAMAMILPSYGATAKLRPVFSLISLPMPSISVSALPSCYRVCVC